MIIVGYWMFFIGSPVVLTEVSTGFSLQSSYTDIVLQILVLHNKRGTKVVDADIQYQFNFLKAYDIFF